jgi:hypothetical protein
VGGIIFIGTGYFFVGTGFYSIGIEIFKTATMEIIEIAQKQKRSICLR